MKKVAVLLAITLLASCSKTTYEEHLAKAKEFINKNDALSAEIELKNAIRLQPKEAEIRFLLGKIYLEQRKYESAEKELNRALTNGFDAGKVMPLLSKAYHNSGTNVALTKLKHKKAGLTPKQAVEIAFYKLQAFIELGKEEKAKSLIKEIKEQKVQSNFKRLALTYDMLLKENEPAAHLLLDEVLQDDAVQPDALKLKANILLTAKKTEEAITYFQQYYQAYPEDNQIAFLLARLLTDNKQTDKAEEIVDRLLTLNDNHVLLNQLKTVARYNAKDYVAALEFAEKAVNGDPNNIPARVLAGYSAYFIKNYNKANTHLSAIAGDLPTDHPGLRLLAASQLQLGQTLAANDTLSQFQQVNSQDASLLSSIGLSLVRSGEISKAKAVVDKIGDSSQGARALAQLGTLQLSLNDIDGIAKLEQADELATDKTDIRKTLAKAYLSTSNFNKALELAKTWKQDSGDNSDAWILSGIVHLQQGNIDIAYDEFNQLLLKQPNNVRALLALATIEHKKENSEAVSSYIDRILKIEPTNLTALMQKYIKAKEQGKTADFIQSLKRDVSNNSENVTLQLLLARVLLNESQYDESIAVLNEISNEDKNLSGYWQVLAQAYWRKGDFLSANKHFKQWLVNEPNNQSALLGNLVFLDGQKDFSQGLALTQKYLEKDPDNTQLQLLKINFLIMTNDFNAAKPLLNDLTESVKSLPFAKGLLGMTQLFDDKYDLAIDNLMQAYEASPRSRNVRVVYLGLLKLNKQQQANEFVKNHTIKYPKDVESLMLLANSQIKENTEDAIKSYEQVVKVHSNNFVALNNLAYFYIEKGQLDKAKSYAERAVSIKPEHADVLDTLAKVYILKKDYPKALTYLTKAIADNKVKEEIYLNYIEALALNNQLALAKRKISQRNFTLAASQAKAADLKQKYSLN